MKKMLRKYKIEAYEKELHKELSKLAKSFEEWQNGTISSGEFGYRIHEYEEGHHANFIKNIITVMT